MMTHIASSQQSLHDSLRAQHKTRWLDVGCGGNFEEGFEYIDVFPEGLVPASARSRYTRLDILSASQDSLDDLGRFDLVRLQHVLEHFTWEDGTIAIKNCAGLLNPSGVLLITTPDLAIHASRYLQGTYREDPGFSKWATQRIPEGAPDSCYFSMFAHSMIYEPHLWCYDRAGLEFKLSIVRSLDRIECLDISSPLASVPFTHNRPNEDVCVIARKR